MRDAVRASIGHLVGHHVGLAYTTLAPVGPDGKVPDGEKVGQRGAWLEDLAIVPVAEDYRAYLDAWIDSFRGTTCRLFRLTLDRRLLIGHGNTSGSDVGLTVHHTWGTPLIPGSALKGITAHHVAESYGRPLDAAVAAPPRELWRGVTWKGRSVARGPGPSYRGLFGAPDAEDDVTGAAGATRGFVVFHDAQYLGVADRLVRDELSPNPERTCPFDRDVLTVHQSTYYNGHGAIDPSDHDDPNPVGFLTVSPRVQFVVALEGPADWTALAHRLLGEALASRGVGGKSTSGYGRGTLVEVQPPAPPPSALVTDFDAALGAQRDAGASQATLVAFIRDQWLERMRVAPASDRKAATVLIRKAIKRNAKSAAWIQDLCTGLEGG